MINWIPVWNEIGLYRPLQWVVQCGEDKDKSSWVWRKSEGFSVLVLTFPCLHSNQEDKRCLSTRVLWLKVLSISRLENIFIVTQLGDKTRATKTMLPCLPKVKRLLTKVYFKMKIFSDMIYVPIFRQSDFHLELSHWHEGPLFSIFRVYFLRCQASKWLDDRMERDFWLYFPLFLLVWDIPNFMSRYC